MIINGIRNVALQKKLRRISELASNILQQPALQDVNAESETIAPYTANTFVNDLEALTSFAQTSTTSCSTPNDLKNAPLPEIEKKLTQLSRAFEDNRILDSGQLEDLLKEQQYGELHNQIQSITN